MSRVVLVLAIAAVATLPVMGCGSGPPPPTAPNARSNQEALNAKSGTGPGVLLQLGGNGSENSAPFLVAASPVKVSYTYDCSSLATASSTGANDNEAIADVNGANGSALVTVYLQDPGSYYYVQVASQCQWSLTVLKS